MKGYSLSCYGSNAAMWTLSLLLKRRRRGAIVWHCFAVAEVPFWKRLFRRQDTAVALQKLEEDVGAILLENSDIQLMDEP
jgi:hypothetical protein